jgi:hypothetical protein
MPNLCDNFLKITGNEKDLAKLQTYFIKNEGGFDLNFARLEKEAGRELDTRFFIVSSKKLKDNLLTIDADTAWSPALEPFVYLTSILPSLVIDYSYYEGGMGLLGRAEIESGNLSNEAFEYGSLEYWQELFSNYAEAGDYLDGWKEADYLATFSPEIRKALNLDAMYYDPTSLVIANQVKNLS